MELLLIRQPELQSSTSVFKASWRTSGLTMLLSLLVPTILCAVSFETEE